MWKLEITWKISWSSHGNNKSGPCLYYVTHFKRKNRIFCCKNLCFTHFVAISNYLNLPAFSIPWLGQVLSFPPGLSFPLKPTLTHCHPLPVTDWVHLTRGTWLLTCDTWHVTHGGEWTFSLAIWVGVVFFWHFDDFKEKDHSTDVYVRIFWRSYSATS